MRGLRVFTSEDSEENGILDRQVPLVPAGSPPRPCEVSSRRGEWHSASEWGSFFAAVSDILQVSGSIQSSGLFQVSGKMRLDRSRNLHSNIQVQI